MTAAQVSHAETVRHQRVNYLDSSPKVNWQNVCCGSLWLIYKACKTGSGSTTTILYKGLVELESNDVLGEILEFDEGQLTNLFRRTFGPEYPDNCQKFPAGQCYRGALPVCDKLTNHGISSHRRDQDAGRPTKHSCTYLFSVRRFRSW